MTMPPPRCGGGSAGTSPRRSPPRPTHDHTLTTAWTSRLAELVGDDRADSLAVQPVVATAGYGSRPRPAARLAARRPPQSRRHPR